ncbi:hypothetical protein [Klebsiella variicola]|uniref:hypothetical protein n=1 Tax=Klebsiella variicola TaxID=244366 RepID=UPI002166FE0F|nr:hypothetical protein [Klebsiella variicola]MCS4331409.1 hypothetical protein [Klebsiella variicola subsp. variicola]
MTDITKLAQREKFEAWWEREYKHLESSKYTDSVPHIKYGFWMAYQAGGAELVEALEKAQQRIGKLEKKLTDHKRMNQEMAKAMLTPNDSDAAGMEISALRQRIAELDTELEREREKSRRVMSRIAELESRTVKLPEVRITIAEAKLRNLTPQQHDAYNAGASRAVAKICQELTAASIKVEAE